MENTIKVTSCSVWTNINSSITVENTDGTRITFEIPVSDKTISEKFDMLMNMANRYIMANSGKAAHE